MSQKYYTINGVGLNLAASGQGEKTTVFLHYFGGSGRTWDAVTARLAHRTRTVALDLRGWGGSDAPRVGYSVEDMGRDVLGLVAKLGLTRYTLAGHSLGGKVAQWVAACRPAGLERLLLVAPSPLTPEPMTEADRDAMRASWGDAPALRQTLTKITTLPLSVETRDAVIADNLRASRAGWEAWADLGSRQDLSADAARIAVPTFILSGTRDAVLPPDVQQREVADRIAGATLTTVPGAGHLLPLEAPDAVADWILTSEPLSPTPPTPAPQKRHAG